LKKRRWLWISLAAAVLLLAVVAWVVFDRFFRETEQVRMTPAGTLEKFADWDLDERFKYGSIGVENEQGIPYWIWLVLPRVFPEYLPGPGGYSALGIVWEPGEELPVGFSKKRIGYDRVGFNCAVCHTATYRKTLGDGRLSNTEIVVGGPAIRFDPQAYLSFLSRSARDPRFNADTLLEAISYNVDLPWLDKLVYRYALIPGTKKALLEQTQANTWMLERPIWGPGRIDPFNPVKFGMLEMDPGGDSTVGNSDMMPLWQMDERKGSDGVRLHWDGLSTNLIDCSVAGALGDGATRKSLPLDHVRQIATQTLAKLQPPAYPGTPRPDLASAGKRIFGERCAACHRANPHFVDGRWTDQSIQHGTQESLEPDATQHFIATDDNRLAMWNPPLPEDSRQPYEIYNDFANGYAWDLNSFVATNGYVAVPLNGIWLCAPYLHNGSVPTLEDLLNPPMPEETVQNLMGDAYQALRERLSRADSTVGLTRQQLADQLEQIKPAVDRLIAGARALGMRPPVFYRGSDVLDPVRVGFVHTSEAVPAGQLVAPYFTAVKGNGNGGHLFGTDLSDAEKRQLIEYLKTL
jgi:mono/diheme cytochrome c family protein